MATSRRDHDQAETTMTETIRAISVALIEHALWVGLGVIAVAVFLHRRSDQTEVQVKAAVGWMENALEAAPDRLYDGVHPNWTVYRKQVAHRLKAAMPELPKAVFELVLAEFDACYQLSEGVYIRIGSLADESQAAQVGFVPLVAPVEGFRLRKVQARRRGRRIRAMTVGLALYLGIVFLALWGLVLARSGLV